jgi:hypothetical protein
MKKQSVALAALVIAGFALTGCSTPDLSNAKRIDQPVEESVETEAPEESSSAGSATAGDLVQPGQTVPAGEWATYEYVDYDGNTAVLNTKLVSVEPASQAQIDLLVGEIPELKGYKVTLVRFQQQKVSGDDITYGANYTDFRPADTEGAQAQEVSVIGWEDCETESFTEEFNAGTEVLDQCIVGASVEGGNDVAGMIWTGNSSADENPFSQYDGTPVFFKN